MSITLSKYNKHKLAIMLYPELCNYNNTMLSRKYNNILLKNNLSKLRDKNIEDFISKYCNKELSRILTLVIFSKYSRITRKKVIELTTLPGWIKNFYECNNEYFDSISINQLEKVYFYHKVIH